MRFRSKLLSLVVPATVLALAAGCGDTGDSEGERTVTVVEKVVPAPSSKEKEPTEAPATSDTDLPSADSSGGSITVPNVVGHDHQLAQDEMQAVGLYLLDEKDCTGQDRMLLFDRNWTVVEQDPPAGTRVGEDTTITLCSKKDGE